VSRQFVHSLFGRLNLFKLRPAPLVLPRRIFNSCSPSLRTLPMFVHGWSASALFLAFLGQAVAFDLLTVFQFVKRQTTFEVTSPQFGDTFSVTDDGEDSAIPIKWTVADDIANRPIYISLLWGNNLTTLEPVEIVNSKDPACNASSYRPKLTTDKSNDSEQRLLHMAGKRRQRSWKLCFGI